MSLSKFCPIFTLLATFTIASAGAAPAIFVHQGQIIMADSTTSSVLRPRPRATSANSTTTVGLEQLQVSNYWGRQPNGKLLITLKPDVSHDALVEEDHHCSSHTPGECGFLIAPDGTVDTEISIDILRAYPSPATNYIAIVTSHRNLMLWQDDQLTTISTPGKVSHVGWSPDGRYIVAAVRPPDWSEAAVSSARSTAEFLRLQNADLHLFDTASMQFVAQLTDDPGSEFAPFFSPDGKSLYYNWSHLTEDIGGLMRLDLDRDDRTSASAPATKLTVAGNDRGEVPFGRVTTHLWTKAGTQLVFESGLSDGFGEIWTMKATGQGAVKLDTGRKPQLLNQSDVAFIDRQGRPAVITPEVAQ